MKLLRCVYADADGDEVTRTLREEVPELSAYRTVLSMAQTILAFVLGFILAVGLLADLPLTTAVLVGSATAFFLISTSFRALTSPTGCRTLVDGSVARCGVRGCRDAGRSDGSRRRGWRERGERP